MLTHGPLVPHQYCNRAVATHVVNVLSTANFRRSPAQSADAGATNTNRTNGPHASRRKTKGILRA
jgi:hypothetical protein